MKNKTYLKASLREIRQSKGRFIAITLIIFRNVSLCRCQSDGTDPEPFRK